MFFFENLFWNRKNVISQNKQGEIVLPRDNKELFVQHFI